MWTTESAIAHLLALRDADQRAIAAALVATEKATDKAYLASEKRFESVNEFRQALAGQQAAYITRSETYTLVSLACAIASAIGAVIGHFLR